MMWTTAKVKICPWQEWDIYIGRIQGVSLVPADECWWTESASVYAIIDSRGLHD